MTTIDRVQLHHTITASVITRGPRNAFSAAERDVASIRLQQLDGEAGVRVTGVSGESIWIPLCSVAYVQAAEEAAPKRTKRKRNVAADARGANATGNE